MSETNWNQLFEAKCIGCSLNVKVGEHPLPLHPIPAPLSDSSDWASDTGREWDFRVQDNRPWSWRESGRRWPQSAYRRCRSARQHARRHRWTKSSPPARTWRDRRDDRGLCVRLHTHTRTSREHTHTHPLLPRGVSTRFSGWKSTTLTTKPRLIPIVCITYLYLCMFGELTPTRWRRLCDAYSVC